MRPDGTRQRNRTTQNEPRKQRKHNIDNIQRDIRTRLPIRLISPQQLHRQSKAKGHDNSCFTTEETTATLFHGGDTFTCAYHPKTKIPTIFCITNKTEKRTYTPSSTNLAQQPSYKKRKRVIVNETNNTTAPNAYISNLNTAQQELLRLHESYAHVNMKEIQQHMENCDIKAYRQVRTCQIPKCLSCCKNKGKKRSHHKKHRGSIAQDDGQPISNTSIDHIDAANVPGYTWQHKGQPTLEKSKIFMLFVDRNTRRVYPSFQESKTASEACRSKCDYETFAKCYKVNVGSYHADNGAFRTKTFKKKPKKNPATKLQRCKRTIAKRTCRKISRNNTCRSTINAKSHNLQMGQNHNS
jgi:hypothetical protein